MSSLGLPEGLQNSGVRESPGEALRHAGRRGGSWPTSLLFIYLIIVWHRFIEQGRDKTAEKYYKGLTFYSIHKKSLVKQRKSSLKLALQGELI